MRTLPALWLCLIVALMANHAAAQTNPLLRTDSRNVRIAAWNTEKRLMSTAEPENSAFQRILRALDPDVISFVEVDPAYTAAQVRTRLTTLMPLPSGLTWNVTLGKSDGYNRNVLASRYPQSMQIQDTVPAANLRGVTAALIDLPDTTYTKNLYVMGLHLKCCSDGTAQRQQECDALAKWFGDLRTAGGNVNVASGTPLIAIGDFNFVDTEPQAPEVTLRTGNISDNATYGADIKGDWDATDLADLTPHDLVTSDLEIWPSGTTNPTSRLDRAYYTDSAMSIAKSFVLNTRTLSSAQLTVAGLQSTDCENAADHLPIAFDITWTSLPVAASSMTCE